MRNAHSLILATLTLGGCMEGPLTGDTVADADVKNHAFQFSGRSDTPDAGVKVYVLSDPSGDPALQSSYTLVGTTVTGSSPKYFQGNTADPFYLWSVQATPAPGSWPQGGLIRLKAQSAFNGAKSPQDMYTFDNESASCEAAAAFVPGATWQGVGSGCQSPYGLQIATVVSTTPTPAQKYTDASSEAYLSRGGGLSSAGFVSPNSKKFYTGNYYIETGAEADLTTFRTHYGFDQSNTDEAKAIYYNYGDLGLGRDMHCKSFPSGQGLTGRACYVTNYGQQGGATPVPVFGQDPETSIGQASAGSHPIATVAMVYDPFIPSNAVRFVVFDSKGDRSDFAALDNPGYTASKSLDAQTYANITVPDNCLTCHGGNSAYTRAGRGPVKILGARFLPFDPSSMRFSHNIDAYSAQNMLPQIRQLNAHVMGTPTSAAISQFITGMYAPKLVTDATAVANTDWVPPDWQSGGKKAVQVYNEVVKPYCRTCHLAQDVTTDWTSWLGFDGYNPEINEYVCGSHGAGNAPMPQSERTQTLLWQSPARAHLVNALGIKGGCAP